MQLGPGTLLGLGHVGLSATGLGPGDRGAHVCALAGLPAGRFGRSSSCATLRVEGPFLPAHVTGVRWAFGGGRLMYRIWSETAFLLLNRKPLPPLVSCHCECHY